ncbi:555_t:CDS:1 [Ambispora gerdemannii]|uniref:555_t:CDS:1 n=1 Tax=Ambispora gerdemannii TaxID=144530 RepID=A0A9N9ARP8_9GLOM|nr:555_t:CDS:1 [Ambispora gerdemannii]
MPPYKSRPQRASIRRKTGVGEDKTEETSETVTSRNKKENEKKGKVNLPLSKQKDITVITTVAATTQKKTKKKNAIPAEEISTQTDVAIVGSVRDARTTKTKSDPSDTTEAVIDVNEARASARTTRITRATTRSVKASKSRRTEAAIAANRARYAAKLARIDRIKAMKKSVPFSDVIIAEKESASKIENDNNVQKDSNTTVIGDDAKCINLAKIIICEPTSTNTIMTTIPSISNLLNSSADDEKEDTTMVEGATMVDTEGISDLEINDVSNISSIIPGSLVMEDMSIEFTSTNHSNNNEASSLSIHHVPSNFALTDDVLTLQPPLSPMSSHETIRSSSSAGNTTPYITAEECFSPQSSFDEMDDENTLIDDRNVENNYLLGREQQLSVLATKPPNHSPFHQVPPPPISLFQSSNTASLTRSHFLKDSSNLFIKENKQIDGRLPNSELINPPPSLPSKSDRNSSKRTTESLNNRGDQENTYKSAFKSLKDDKDRIRNGSNNGNNNTRYYETPMQRVEVATLGGHKIITDVKLDVQQMQVS